MEKRDLNFRKEKETLQLLNLITLASCMTNYFSHTRLVATLTDFYAFLLGKNFTAHQTINIIYAQVWLFLTLMPFTLNLGWRMLFFVWFCQALNRSKIIDLFIQEQ